MKTSAYRGNEFEGTAVAMKLLSDCGLLQSGRCVVTDNYYTSTEFSQRAREAGLFTLGILRTSRVPQGQSLLACTLRRRR